jgi:hypothetical protein
MKEKKRRKRERKKEIALTKIASWAGRARDGEVG